MLTSSIHGLPRIGPRRELKTALEAHWRREASADELLDTGRTIRRANWELMRAAGIDLIPSNDFSLYDHVLDAAVLVGGHRPDGLDGYFELARGDRPLELTKWFDTNYHHLVPELSGDFRLASTKPFDEVAEARALGIETKPVLLGPVSLLLLSRSASLQPLDALLDVYAEILQRLDTAWVQLDEPCFAADRDEAELAALERALARLGGLTGRPRLCVSTYFDHAGDALGVLARAPIEGVGLDFVRGRRNRDLLRAAGGLPDRSLFAGVVDGRNVWACDLDGTLGLLDELQGLCGELVVSSASSFLHVPLDLGAEGELDDELRTWLAFARQKVREVALLARGAGDGADAIAAELEENRRALASRARSPRTVRADVRDRLQAVGADDEQRAAPYERRASAQRDRLALPPLPTTTIGSFPQTAELRAARAAWRRGDLDDAAYRDRMRAEIEGVIRLQERLGLDVLVHGEPERDDMVRYFAAALDGFAMTQSGWVQSYGSRCVRPPILYGDVARPEPITVDWTLFAQSLTSQPVKGMLTGPITILQWSFVRDDQPRRDTCRQLALAVRDEVADLERAGIAVIQVDEPAIREGLPLRAERREEYMRWATAAFRLATGGAGEATQVQTHMCYSDFGDVGEHIQALDADVVLIEAARSRMDLLDQWRDYDLALGPGVYDIHSPRVPSAEEMADLLRRAIAVFPAQRLWVGPDCGLKTRRPEEVEPALANMVAAARQVREELPE